jgi:outer membrane protein assembly factor BamB
MKKFPFSPSRIVMALMLLAMSMLLSACGGQVLETWPGVSTDASGNVIYLAAGAHVYTVDATNGTETGRTPKDAGKLTFYTPPAFTADGALLLGSYNHSFYEMQPGANDPAWTFAEAKDRFVATPVVAGDTIIAPNGDGNVYGLSLTGQRKWAFKSPHGFWGSPVISGETAIVAGMDHIIYAINIGDGSLVWKTDDLGGEMVAQPAFDGQTLYIGTFGSKNNVPDEMSQMIAVSAADGKEVWRKPVKGWVWSTPTLVDGVLYFGDQEGVVYAFNAADGSQVWQVQPEDSATRNIIASPLVTADQVYIVNKSGALYALRRSDGGTVWNKVIGGQIYSTPMLAAGLIVVAPMNFESSLVAFDAAGNQKWAFTPAK